MPNFKPKDYVAILLILGVLILNWRGVQTMLSSAVLIVIGYYFAKRENKSDSGE